ncbi:MAG: hypothetical protein E7547_02875 [Ruminococcaceae bacterium]|nr:hypothetical protein [Oscillospiraceae bacterium]
MTDLEKVREWIKTFPKFDGISEFNVDYTDNIPANGGIFPSGLVEISRVEDVIGNVTVENQYNFGLYYVFSKAPEDDIGAALNADWIMEFQQWVQEQSILGKAPTFGNTGEKEKASAQNGVLYDADIEGVATYMVQLSFNFKKKYEVK